MHFHVFYDSGSAIPSNMDVLVIVADAVTADGKSELLFRYVDSIVSCVYTDLFFLQTLHFSYLFSYFLQCMCYEVLVQCRAC